LLGIVVLGGRTGCNPDTIPALAEKLLPHLQSAFAKGLWAALPDFHIELLNAGEIEPGAVAHHWLLKGTNTAEEPTAAQPTGRAIALKGASITAQ
jgi:hypothetical protein